MKKSLSLLLVVLFCVSLVLVGCQKTATPAPTTGTTEATAAPEATAPAGNTEAVATDRADRESIVIALQGEPTMLDHQFAAEDGSNRSWPSFGRWVCGGMPQSSKDAYVWVQLPEGGAL